MLTVAPALLVAALLALVGTLVTCAGLALLRTVRRARLAAVGPALDEPGAMVSIRSTAHAGVLLATALLGAALAARALGVGHAPWSNMYEFSAAFAFGTLLAYLALERRLPIRALAPAVAAIAALLVAYALTLPDEARPLVPALQQPILLTVHVGSAMLAYGIYAVAFAIALAELAARRWALAWLPAPPALRAATHRAVALGFPVLTAAIALGALWANLAWRSFWSNDPKELAAAATWFIFAAYLHVAGRRDGWGRAAPWFIVAGFGAIGFTYFGVNLLIPGEHSYSGL